MNNQIKLKKMHNSNLQKQIIWKGKEKRRKMYSIDLPIEYRYIKQNIYVWNKSIVVLFNKKILFNILKH